MFSGQLQLLSFCLDAIQCKFTQQNRKFTEKSIKVLNDYENLYEELLSKSAIFSMIVERLRAICVELYKTINKVNPNFMRDLFKLRLTSGPALEKYKMNMIIPEFNQISYGKKSLKTFYPKLWNSLPYLIKSFENLESFKKTIKHWNGERRLCKVCNYS